MSNVAILIVYSHSENDQTNQCLLRREELVAMVEFSCNKSKKLPKESIALLPTSSTGSQEIRVVLMDVQNIPVIYEAFCAK